jgi:hypothetical protein
MRENGTVPVSATPAASLTRRRVLFSRAIRALARFRVDLRWYSDWRWRYIRDRIGLGIWVGPLAIYLWSDRDHVRSR